MRKGQTSDATQEARFSETESETRPSRGRKPLRIIHFTERFPTVSETFITDRVRWQAEAGHSVMVCARAKGNAPEDWLSEPVWSRIRVIYLSGLPDEDFLVRGYVFMKRVLFSILTHPVRTVRFALGLWIMKLGLRELMANLYVFTPLALFGADILHIHFAHRALPILPYKNLLCKRLFVSLLGYDVTIIPRENPAMYHDLFREADLFLASSRFLVAKAKALGCPEGKLVISYPGISTSFFRPPDVTSASPDSRPLINILTVGRLDWPKGLQYALEAISLVRCSMPNIKYVIVGAGKLRTDLEMLAEHLGITSTVEFRGSQSPLMVRDIMGDADILLLSSIKEEFGLVLAEAQAMRLPIVATRVGGVPEVVEDGVTGFLVPPRDPQALADKLLVLANDPDLRREMGERGRERVKRLFDFSPIMTELEELYYESFY